VHDVLKGTGANFGYQLSYNPTSAKKNVPLSAFWPGDSYVDEVCVSA
jgi:hypothetical protein